MPFAALRETESTGFGVSRAMEDETGKSAAIVGAHTENLRGGFVMGKTCISDEINNFTHFLLIKKGEKALPASAEKNLFLFGWASPPWRLAWVVGSDCQLRRQHDENRKQTG